jgi:hypothetical protein
MVSNIFCEVTAKVDATFLQQLSVAANGDSSSNIDEILRPAGLSRIKRKTRRSTSTWALYGTLDSINAAHSLLSAICSRSQTSCDGSSTDGSASDGQTKSVNVHSARTPLQQAPDGRKSPEFSGRLLQDSHDNVPLTLSLSATADKVTLDMPVSTASEEVALPAGFDTDFADGIPHFEFCSSDYAVTFHDIDYADLLTPPHCGGYNSGQLDPKQKHSDPNHNTPDTNRMSSPTFHLNGSLACSPRGAGRRKLTPRRCKLLATEANSCQDDFMATETWTTDEIAAAREMIGVYME